MHIVQCLEHVYSVTRQQQDTLFHLCLGYLVYVTELFWLQSGSIKEAALIVSVLPVLARLAQP